MLPWDGGVGGDLFEEEGFVLDFVGHFGGLFDVRGKVGFVVDDGVKGLLSRDDGGDGEVKRGADAGVYIVIRPGKLGGVSMASW